MYSLSVNSGVLLSERIRETGGRASGFDYMRLVLAVVIVCFHSVVTSYGKEAQHVVNQSALGYVLRFLLPMFFCLSGFLVAGSLERSRGLFVFLGLRAFRIFPALAVDTIFCALVIGPLLTTLSWREYFAHPVFLQYLENILGVIHYHLPGVFETSPFGEVNGQLWTVPFELECYIVLALLGLFSFHKYPRLFLATLVLPMLVGEAWVLYKHSRPDTDRLLVMYFLAGVSLYLLRDRIRLNLGLFLLMFVASVLCLNIPEIGYLAPIPLVYITVYLGLTNPRKIGLLNQGDYSYGLFLYGFPIQQTVVALIPLGHHWWGNIVFSVPLAFLFAALSWHGVEKRVLARKGILNQIDARLPANPFANLIARLRGVAAA
jgi:peptidoglycan/LPS O-acetylase OafA/YrhL